MSGSSKYRYDDLRVRFEHGPQSTYRVNVRGRGGDASGSFEPPFSEDELESFVETAGRARRQARRLDSRATEKAKSYGGRLFDAVFHHDTRDLFRHSLGLAEESQLGVRITLELSGAPELCNIPWEYLFDSPNFLAASVWTPIVRYMDLPGSRRPLAVSPPLKILGVISSPVNVSNLDVDEERTKLERALSRSVGAGEVTVTWTEDATLDGLRRALRDDDYHVLHFIGHGGFVERGQEGVLLFENDRRGSAEISGWELGLIVNDHRSLRLVVLNACEGARTSVDDPFAGVATALVERGVPAVIAMQFEITDTAAIKFSEELYTAVAADFPIDAALGEARKAVFAAGNDLEWGTPVLFLRVGDGRIFAVHQPEPGLVSEPRLERKPEPPNAMSSSPGPRSAAQPTKAPTKVEPAKPRRKVPIGLPVGQLIELLTPFRDTGLHVSPEIPPAMATKARATLSVPSDEPILVLIDLAWFSAAANALVVTDRAIHHRKLGSETHIPFEDLPATKVRLTGSGIAVGRGVVLGFGGMAAPVRKVESMLKALVKACEEHLHQMQPHDARRHGEAESSRARPETGSESTRETDLLPNREELLTRLAGYLAVMKGTE